MKKTYGKKLETMSIFLAGYTIFLAGGAWHIKRPYGGVYVRSYMTLANAKRFVEKRLGY